MPENPGVPGVSGGDFRPLPAEEVRAGLRTLLETDLSFTGVPGNYATHSLHPFAARFPPQIPALFIEGLTRRGEIVLDPLVGSGTVLVEVIQRGRAGIGCDLDPLAVLIAGAKSTPLDREEVEAAFKRVMERAPSERPPPVRSKKIREFRDYWFLPETCGELERLAAAIDREESPTIRRFLKVVFSSTIVAKSAGVSLARDLAHSRPHRDQAKKVRPAREEFERKYRKAVEILGSIDRSKGKATASRADARSLPLPSNSVDLIVTSPPYASAVDYVRAHKFALNWLGHDLDDLMKLRKSYLGAETTDGGAQPNPEGPDFDDASLAARSVQRVAEVDPRRSRHIARYFRDLRQVLAECHRVLRPGRAALWVVGNSRIRGVDVNTSEVLIDLASSVGFHLGGTRERRLDRDRRLLPQGRVSRGEGIEARVKTEAVIGFLKDSSKNSG